MTAEITRTAPSAVDLRREAARARDAEASRRMLVLPPCSPEPNPVENLRQFRRQSNLANRVFDSYDAIVAVCIVAVCCHARNALLAMQERVSSIPSRDWAQIYAQYRR